MWSSGQYPASPADVTVRRKSLIGSSAALCMRRALVLDQQLVPAPERPADALRALPSGVYTTVVINNGRAEAWDDHIERLSRSLGCLQQQDGQLSAAHLLAADGELKPVDLAADLPRLIAPSLAMALSAVRDEQGADVEASSCTQMATILMFSRASCGYESGDQGRPRVGVYAMPLRAHVLPAPVAVSVVGPPRSDPHLKHSLWATQRLVMEARLPHWAAEGLLATSDGHLLEGLITNFFVVVGTADGRPVVQTASEADGVLGGIMRARVLSACQRLNLPCQERAPILHERHTWREAFLTNSVKRLQPVWSISCTSPEYGGSWRCESSAAPGSVTEALNAAVATDLEQSSTDIEKVLRA